MKRAILVLTALCFFTGSAAAVSAKETKCFKSTNTAGTEINYTWGCGPKKEFTPTTNIRNLKGRNIKKAVKDSKDKSREYIK